MDRAIGEVRRGLAACGLGGAATLLMFTADNGPEDVTHGTPWSHGMTGGFRGRKRSLHEGGMRMPCIVAWPDVIAPCRASSAEFAAGRLAPDGARPCRRRAAAAAAAAPGRDASSVLLGAGVAPPRSDAVLHAEWAFLARFLATSSRRASRRGDTTRRSWYCSSRGQLSGEWRRSGAIVDGEKPGAEAEGAAHGGAEAGRSRNKPFK